MHANNAELTNGRFKMPRTPHANRVGRTPKGGFATPTMYPPVMVRETVSNASGDWRREVGGSDYA